jgi:hypothetical protein
MRNITLVIILVFMFSCTSKQENKESKVEEVKVETFADKAKKYLNTAVDNRFPHEWQNTPQISERDVLIANDSLYVEQFKMRYQNEFGGISNGEITYVYVKTEYGLKYAVEDYAKNHNQKFIMCMADVYNRAPKGKYPMDWDVDDPLLAYNTACLYVLAWGKDVK